MGVRPGGTKLGPGIVAGDASQAGRARLDRHKRHVGMDPVQEGQLPDRCRIVVGGGAEIAAKRGIPLPSGMALDGAGQKDKAKEELKKALQLAPPLAGADAKQAQDTLAKL